MKHIYQPGKLNPSAETWILKEESRLAHLPVILALILLVIAGCSGLSGELNLNLSKDTATITEGSDTVLVYRITGSPEQGDRARAHYIHPLYVPGGAVLTEDMPEDHPHHHGIFWAWHQLYVGDKRIGDGWDIRNFYWEVVDVKEIPGLETARGLSMKVLWKSPDWTDDQGKLKPIVKESATIFVYPETKGHRIIDFEITLLAMEADVRIGGSENEKGYGGFSTRIRLPEDVIFTGPAGTVIPDNLPVVSEGWVDISGSFGPKESIAGLTIISHPGNPGYPNPWILRASGSAQNAVYPHPGATAVPLSDSIPTILCYRLVVHSGHANALNIQQIQSDYIHDMVNTATAPDRDQ